MSDSESYASALDYVLAHARRQKAEAAEAATRLETIARGFCSRCRTEPVRSAGHAYCKGCDDLLVSQRAAIRAELGIEKDVEGVCDSCGDRHRLVLDHDHETGNFRGMLCRTCNVAAGMLRDSPRKAMQLAMYLLDARD